MSTYLVMKFCCALPLWLWAQPCKSGQQDFHKQGASIGLESPYAIEISLILLSAFIMNYLCLTLPDQSHPGLVKITDIPDLWMGPGETRSTTQPGPT